MAKPRILLTRRWPEAVQARLARDYDAGFNDADVVPVHCPGGAANRHLVNARALEALGRDGILIDTARGDVVDMEALGSGRIAGAGLDVDVDKPEVPEPLRRMENVVLLPHLGSATMETRVAMGMMVADNLDAFLAGRQPPNRVA